MTSVPYPTFVNTLPVDEANGRTALSAVGKCRIHPETCAGASGSEEYRAVVAKCVDQSSVVEDSSENKKLRKKYMKESVAMAKQFLTKTLKLDVSIVDVEVVVDAYDLIASDGCVAACLLDAGCHAIVTDGTGLAAMDVAKIPRERMVAHFVDGESISDITAAADLASVVSIEHPKGERATIESVTNILQVAAEKQETLNFEVVVQISSKNWSNSNDSELASLVGDVLKQCKDGHGSVTLGDPSANQLGLSFAACMNTDREDGLFTTVVCSRAGEALGLVYSSKESIVAALECGRGVYFSRSRKSLWRKGDTSGHYQTLHRLDVDCDGDALRFTVTQRGEDCAAFCHLNTLTCWGEPRGLRHLEGTLKDRLKSAPEGSYTKRLIDDEQLLRDKLVEEAQELWEAKEPQHVAEELADVLYFAMTRAAKAGVSIDDAVAELDRRSRKVTRRKGDSKAFRIAAGQEILGKKDGKAAGS